MIEKMTSAQKRRTSISIKKSAPSQLLNDVRTAKTKRSRYPEAEQTGLSSIIENKFLDIVILVDGSDSFNQLNGGKIMIAIGKSGEIPFSPPKMTIRFSPPKPYRNLHQNP